jgi:hypothetical protein
MKASIILAIVILAAGAFFGWRQEHRLTAAREVHRQVAAEVRAQGLSPDDIAAAGQPPLPAKRQRADEANREAAAKSFARELVTFALEMKELERSGAPMEGDVHARAMEVMGRFLDLSSSQIKVVIAELRASSEVDDATRREIIGFAVMMLAGEHPESALALFTESSDLVDHDGMSQQVISSALGNWAERDPLGALEWIRKNAEKHPELVTEQAKAAVIAGAAKQDPAFALGLVGELGLKDPGNIAAGLAQAARTAEERTALLAALRGDEKHAELLPPMLAMIGAQLAGEGFESAEAWLSSAALSGKELEGFASGLNHWQTKGDTGRWIEWMAGKLPAEQLPEQVENLVSQWTREDYKAAGEWINGTPEGPAKLAAVKSYARTVAPYDPASAAQWAATLPAGKERGELLRIVHAQWKLHDEAAAATFAAEHGLE